MGVHIVLPHPTIYIATVNITVEFLAVWIAPGFVFNE